MDSEVICNPKKLSLTHLLNNIGLRDAKKRFSGSDSDNGHDEHGGSDEARGGPNLWLQTPQL